jgi:hypothetical protein
MNPDEIEMRNSSNFDGNITCLHANSDNRTKDMKRADALAAIASQYLSY